MKSNEQQKVMTALERVAWIVFCTCMMLICLGEGYQRGKEEATPVVIYTVDNAGGLMTGEITDKEIIEGKYTVTAHTYGKFLVTKEQYNTIKVGDDIPEYLKKRGN